MQLRIRNNKIILAAFSLILVSISVLPLAAGAQQVVPKIGVSPHTFEMEILPGQLIENKIKISNMGDMPFPMTVRIKNFSAEENSGEMVFDEESQDPSFTPSFWFSVEKKDFILEAGETEKINFKIQVPEDAEPGGHYAVLVFEPNLPSFYFKEGSLVKNIPEIGVLFLISIKKFTLEPETSDKLDIVEFSLPKEERITGLEGFVSRTIANVALASDFNISEGRPSKFILRIKNNDIYHIRPFGKVAIYNMFGKRIGEAEIPQLTVLPQKTRLFPVEVQTEIPKSLKWLPDFISELFVKNFFVGRYKAEIELEAKSPLTAQAFKVDTPEFLIFFSLPWRFWIVILIIVTLLAVLIFRFKDRFKKAVKVLISRQ